MKNLADITWHQFLIRLFTLLGCGLLSSGIITGIASNWVYLTKFEKLYSIQILLVGTVGLSIWLYRREAVLRLPIKTMTVEFLVAVIIGGLFALLGQVYQTGADVWQLFALWAVLQLPLMVVLPNVANVLLWLVTFNLALIFMFQDGKITNHLFQLFAANFILWVIAEYRLLLKIDPWRIVVRLLLLWLAVISVFALLFSSLSGNIGLILTALWGGIVYFYYKNNRDKVGYILSFCVLLYGINLLLMMIVKDTNQSYPFVIFMIAVNIFAVSFLGRQFLHWKNARDFTLSSQQWVQILYFLLSVIALLFSFFLVSLVAQLENWTLFLQISAIGLSVAGYLFQRFKNDIFSSACFAVGLTFILLLNIDAKWQFVALLYYFLVYGFSKVLWLRTFAICCVIYHNVQLFGAFSYVDELLFFGCLAIFGFSPKMSDKQALVFLPWGWALLFYLFAQWGIEGFNNGSQALNYEPELHSMIDLFNVLSNRVFENSVWNISTFLRCLIVISPLVVFGLLSRVYGGRQNKLMLLVLLWTCIVFSATPVVLLYLSLLLLAYHLRSWALLSVNFLFILFFLFNYYYWLALPLLYKSVVLLVQGAGLLTLAFLFYRREKCAGQAVRLVPKFAKKRVPITILFTLFISLGIANFMIIQNEEILEKGTPIILKLEPKDPRSLIQGDYMDLNYTLLDQINEQLPNFGLAESRVYALLTREESGVMNLCRIEMQPPENFTGCAAGIYLPIYIDEYWKILLPGQQYFFPEGKAKYYQQAKYGEYRFKNGKVLLARLLDEHLMPL